MQTMLMNVLVGYGCIALRGVICVGFNRGQQKMSIDVVNKLVTFMVRLTSSSKRVLAPTMLALFYRLCFPFYYIFPCAAVFMFILLQVLSLLLLSYFCKTAVSEKQHTDCHHPHTRVAQLHTCTLAHLHTRLRAKIHPHTRMRAHTHTHTHTPARTRTHPIPTA